MEKQNFVLVHGAWHGGWCWVRVAAILRARGHTVTTPTQTGLGERSHLLTADVDLGTFTADIVNHLQFEDLSGVTLVGHSFAGNAITGTAHSCPERIARMVYLDARVPVSGDPAPSDMERERLDGLGPQAEAFSGGLSLPVPSGEVFGLRDADDRAWVESRMTPHPYRTFADSLRFEGRPDNGLPARYVVVTDPVYGPLEPSRARAQALGWPMDEIATGHDAMVSAPEALADLLENG